MVSARLPLMLVLTFLLVQISVSATVRSRRNACREAFNGCNFRFQGSSGLRTFSVMGDPDMAFTSRIVSKNSAEILGVLNSNNIAPQFILPSGAANSITLFGNPPFTPTHFKPFSIPYTSGSGIGHQTFHGNQQAVAKGKCIRVFFTSYQTLFPNGDVKGNINNARECAVFRTFA